MTNEQRARAALKALIRDQGGPTRFARALGSVSRQQVEQWDLIPLKYLKGTKRVFGLGLKELRPDVLDYL